MAISLFKNQKKKSRRKKKKNQNLLGQMGRPSLNLLAGLLVVMSAFGVFAVFHSHAAIASPCGQTTAAPAQYDHVIWILEENHDLNNTNPSAAPDGNGVIGNANAPFINSLARSCGYTTSWVDDLPALHSEPHYLAEISGSNCDTGWNTNGTHCILDDNGPSAHVLSTSVSLFEQLTGAGKTWKSYQEGASGNCVGSVAKHDAAVFYTRIHAACLTNDIPFTTWTSGVPTGVLANDIVNNRLPNFAYITPNENHDMHVSTGGKVGVGDAWLNAYIPLITNSATYRAGRTVIFVSWDEGYPSGGQLVPNLVIAPTVPGGAVSTNLNGMGMLRTTEALFGLSYLGCAGGTPPGGSGTCPAGSTTDLRSTFHLTGSGTPPPTSPPPTSPPPTSPPPTSPPPTSPPPTSPPPTSPPPSPISDHTPPTVPTNLHVLSVTSKSVSLDWNDSTDAVGVTGYRVYRSGVLTGSSGVSNGIDTGLSPGASYTYTVKAYDAAGNISGLSNSVKATTSPLGTGAIITLLKPVSGQFLRGKIAISVTLNAAALGQTDHLWLRIDNKFVKKVTVSPTDASIYFTWDSASVPNGNHVMRVSARTANDSFIDVDVANVLVRNQNQCTPYWFGETKYLCF